MVRQTLWSPLRSLGARLLVSAGICLGAGAGGAVLAAETSAHDATLSKAHEWLQQGQAKTAYDLLAPLEPELAGIPSYDWLFGQAALNSDRPSEAAFAFERCLAVDRKSTRL